MRVVSAYNIVGGIPLRATVIGYFLGMPVVKNNLELVILSIVFLSILPGITAVGRNLMRCRGAAPEVGSSPSDRGP